MITHTANGSAVLGIAGWKNSGKTTMVARLTEEMTGRGYRVSTVKHAHHAFDIDHEGTDSFRHRAAGAGEVVLVSAARMATMVEFRGAPEPSFADVLDKVAACDLILVEGYRREDHAKLEVRRTGQQDEKPLPTDPATILAIITEEDPLEGKPHFHPHAVDDIADFVEKACGLKGR